MMPPTSIDGTDITGATIDGTEVQEITVDGQTVFSAGPPIIEDFEDGNLNEYSGDTGDFGLSTTEVKNGSTSLELKVDGNNRKISTSSKQIPHGTTKFNVYLTQDNVSFFVVYGNPSGSSFNDSYVFGKNNADGTLFWKKYSGGSFVRNETSSCNFPENEWIECELNWTSGGSHTLTVRNASGTQIGQVTATDSEYSPNGLGFNHNKSSGSSTAYIDFIRGPL